MRLRICGPLAANRFGNKVNNNGVGFRTLTSSPTRKPSPYIRRRQLFNMDTAVIHMTPEELSQSFKTAQLERAYESALREAERIYEEERARVLRVQLLLLQDENDVLQDQVEENSMQLENLEAGNDELRQQLLETEADLQRVQAELKVRMRDLERCKAEAQALSATSSDSTKILTEKLALARELANLKPELEHLKSQATTQQTVLAEKLALQREVSALQVELETEKRAVQRLKSHDKRPEVETGLEAELEELKKELAKEKRETQKVERENRKKTVEWESQRETLEGKLDAFRNKLRSTKEQLKEAKDEIDRVQAAQFAKSAELAAARATGGNPRKRNVPHFDPDMTIGTPGHGIGRQAAKRAKTTSASRMSGTEKTSFSITPFLNRTLSILPESPSQAEENLSKHIEQLAAEADQSSSPITRRKAGEGKKDSQIKNTGTISTEKHVVLPQPLKETTNPKANTTVKKPQLAKVMEEEEEENSPAKDDPPNFEGDQPVKRQRVLGQKKKIFQAESDAEPTKGPRKLGMGLRGGGGFGDLSFMAAPGGKKGKTLAAFSPLKKDRKAAATAVVDA